MSIEAVYALTSLAPSPERAESQRSCIVSWQDAGLQVRSFNHPSEIGALAPQYDVEFVPIEQSSAAVFGRHFIRLRRFDGAWRT